MTTLTTRRPAPKRRRFALEELAPAGKPKLRVDRAKGVIYRVRIGGRLSKNTHGERGVEGSEYLREAYDEAKPLYEGIKVRVNHPAGRDVARNVARNSERDTHDSFGVIRNPRTEDDGNGDWGFYGDLHYLKSHPLAESVLEDVERGLGVYGLSHHAYPSKESIRGKRLVFERIGKVESVDLVDKPATNRNLWEDEAAAAVGCDPAEQFISAFDQLVLDVVHNDNLTPAAKAKRIAELLEKLESLLDDVERHDEEHGDPPLTSTRDDDNGERKSVASIGAKESVRRKREARFREICDSVGWRPSSVMFKAGARLTSDEARRAFVQEMKPAPAAAAQIAALRGAGLSIVHRRRLESSRPAALQMQRLRGGGARPVLESTPGVDQVPTTAVDQMRFLRGGSR